MNSYAQAKVAKTPDLQGFLSIYESLCEGILVPLAGIEPALLAELDFESSASTNSATGAFATAAARPEVVKRAEYSGRGGRVNPLVLKRLSGGFVVRNHVPRGSRPAQNTPL